MRKDREKSMTEEQESGRFGNSTALMARGAEGQQRKNHRGILSTIVVIISLCF